MKILVQHQFAKKSEVIRPKVIASRQPQTAEKPQVSSPVAVGKSAKNFSLAGEKLEQELALGASMSIIRLIDFLVECGHRLRASDIHIDPGPNHVRLRFRIDGVLQDLYEFPKNLHAEIISRIKILSGMRTDEHQSAQDGRFRLTLQDGQSVDVRVSVVPAYYGENAVLRLLSDKAEEFNLKSLGFSQSNEEKILSAIRKPYGMILATGPTGSGKTTTLYTLVKMLNTKEVSIITIEDPIEYSVSGINQIQVNSRSNLSFANGLRSILRQDPNIIMVGEIRDMETAGLAVNTALTGHLMLSTLHTNDAPATILRLLDMKVEPYLIASTVNAAIGQRLVRRICKHCKAPKAITGAEIKSLTGLLPTNFFEENNIFYYGQGCQNCGHTGFKGRIGIHEVLIMNQTVREAVLKKASVNEVRQVAIKQGMVPMVLDGFEKATLGLTTVEEVLRMLHE